MYSYSCYLNNINDSITFICHTVEGKIEDLEAKFGDIQDNLLSHMKSDQTVTPDLLFRALITLPLSLKAQFTRFISENLDALKRSRADDIDAMYSHLSPLITFIDYSLLEHLVKKFGTAHLKDSMTTYISSVQEFLDETTVAHLIELWPGKQQPPPNFEILRAEIKGNPRTCSLRQIEQLRRRFCQETQLSEIVFVLIGAKTSNSFILLLMFPSVLAPLVAEAFSKLSDGFCERERIISLSLDKHRHLYLSVALREKKVCGDTVCSLSEFNVGRREGVGRIFLPFSLCCYP